MAFFTSKGQEVTLSKKLGEGGEGYVAELSSQHKGFVAKIYHKTLPTDKQQKLIYMLQGSSAPLTRVSAWPVDILYDSQKKNIRGFLMQSLADYIPIHSVYSPVDRKSIFPDKDWAFLVNVARNIAAAFAVMHQNNVVIGDVNQNSVYVSGDSTVKLIDCDSFQIKNSGKIYSCSVGQREFTPPELRKIASLEGLSRTQNQDNFCLAILIFSTLLMGRHPFAGVYAGRGDMPIEKAIEQNLYAYCLKNENKLMTPPPGSMLPSILSPSLIENFEKAFSGNSTYGGRPNALEWIRSLDALQQKLRTCGNDPIHKYFGGLSSCPWCHNEQETARSFFISKIALTAFKSFDLAGVWLKIESVHVPEPAPLIQTDSQAISPKPLPEHLRGAKFFLALQKIAIIGIAFGVISAYPVSWIIVIPIAWLIFANIKNSELAAEIQTRRLALSKAQTVLSEANKTWDNAASDRMFQSRKQELKQFKVQHESLQADFAKEKAQLQQAIRQNQLNRFLSQYRISNSKIDGVGPARKDTLRSFGIETAADIQYHRVTCISGFGPHLAGKLDSWRRRLEARFVFDPTRGIDPSDMASLKQKFALRKKELEGKLLSGPEDLMIINQTIKRNREKLLPHMRQLSLDLAQANSDLATVS